jgi:hypothetical protein
MELRRSEVRLGKDKPTDQFFLTCFESLLAVARLSELGPFNGEKQPLYPVLACNVPGQFDLVWRDFQPNPITVTRFLAVLMGRVRFSTLTANMSNTEKKRGVHLARLEILAFK